MLTVLALPVVPPANWEPRTVTETSELSRCAGGYIQVATSRVHSTCTYNINNIRVSRSNFSVLQALCFSISTENRAYYKQFAFYCFKKFQASKKLWPVEVGTQAPFAE